MITPEALLHLSKDKKIKPVIETIEVEIPAGDQDLYGRLIRAIVYQQLSGKAAATIHGRFLDLFPDNYPLPGPLLALDLPTLRSVGLSRQKATYIQNVAEFFQEEKLENKDWSTLEDEAIIEYLTQIKDVERWTMEMILMFTLNRPDVLPLDDLVIQQSIQRLYGFEAKGKVLKARMLEVAEAWRPYRTVASVYLWEWKDRG